MAHTEVRFTFQPLAPYRDILIAELSELGFEAFEEDDEGLKAFIRSEHFSAEHLKGLSPVKDPSLQLRYDLREIEEKNWNAEWEAAYEPIEIGNVRVRASFHQPSAAVQYDILINPRMSFGTGHHATTRLMLHRAAAMELQALDVLDMGCGTAVIAILAKMKDAAHVDAIDIDENCVRNAMENKALNGVEIHVQKGGSEKLSGQCYDVIFANINRNVLLQDMVAYHAALKKGGHLVMSGFYQKDVEALSGKAAALGMEFVSKANEAEWFRLEFKK